MKTVGSAATEKLCEHGLKQTRIIDSRLTPAFSIYRRRECLICKNRFTTYELPNIILKKLKRVNKLTGTLVELGKNLID